MSTNKRPVQQRTRRAKLVHAYLDEQFDRLVIVSRNGESLRIETQIPCGEATLEYLYRTIRRAMKRRIELKRKELQLAESSLNE